MNLVEWFNKGMTPEEYINSMEKHQDNLKTILQRFEVPAGDEAFLANVKDEELLVIVITEDWCGDAMLNVPILLKIAEKSGLEVRMLLRDQNLELMDQYLTNGTARSIPIFIFIDKEGNERAVWGPRAETLQQYVEEQRSKLPDKEDETFAEKQSEMYSQMMKRNVSDSTVWDEVYNSIKNRLQ
ncbi:thioredoxin family protein [Bacillus sp. FJAT-49711]|uniref:thioredoxin family protein n=1 Tax=Bacillus sp. FJAT-49711 TaxID=2833585 RepID=UPI001BCA436D|nr:thioredoxin family protein [Bacillus sp. FJAT-49711]MBS4220580.1 thioredoxin family protein [Bacillus sp. FJAT-49711]